MSALMDHAEHGLPSRNMVWDRISMQNLATLQAVLLEEPTVVL
jgi:hypothetical protein